MNANTLSTLIGDVIVILGLVANYLKTRSVSKTVSQNQPPKP